MTKRIPVGFLMLLILVPPVQGATDWSIFGGGAQVGSVRSGSGEVDFSGYTVAGLRYERYYAIFGLEGSFAYLRNALAIEGLPEEAGIRSTGSLVINLPLAGKLPYISFGLGVFHRFGDTFPNVGTRFLTNFGTGIKFRKIAGPAGLRLDYRRHTIHGVLDDDLKANEFTLGLILSF